MNKEDATKRILEWLEHYSNDKWDFNLWTFTHKELIKIEMSKK